MVSTFTTDLFNSAFTGFEYQGQFGLFQADKYILFQVSFLKEKQSYIICSLEISCLIFGA